jgi:hypothetical protein
MTSRFGWCCCGRVAEAHDISEIIQNAPRPQRRAKKTANDGTANEDKAKEMVARHARYKNACHGRLYVSLPSSLFA